MISSNVAILGYGVVGSGVAEIIDNDSDYLSELCGKRVRIKYILDRRSFPDSKFNSFIISDFSKIVSDESIDTVIECLGGTEPAYGWCLDALMHGKNVITSNKQLVAEKGCELLKAARDSGANFLFEASVGGGIPCLESAYSALSGSRVKKVYGILNGTTNYILSNMKECGLSYEDALSEAQKKGYAEANPDADVLGLDSARKIAIFADIIWHSKIDSSSFTVTGINAVSDDDIRLADEAGYVIKLIASAEKINNETYLSVMPTLVDKNSTLSKISGCTNAVIFESENNEPVFMSGAGAGKMATASAVVSDLVKVLNGEKYNSRIYWNEDKNAVTVPAPPKAKYLYYLDSDEASAMEFCEKSSFPASVYKISETGSFIESAPADFSKHVFIKSKLKYIGECLLGYPILK